MLLFFVQWFFSLILNGMKNITVKKKNCILDHVYILGDFIWNFKKNRDAALDVLYALNGKLHLIQGNHDYGIHMPEYRACFQEITSYKKIHDFLQERPQLVILSHYYMPFYESHYYGSILLHGHSHMSPESDLERLITANLISRGITERIYNVGCMYPYMDYTPRTLEEIITPLFYTWKQPESDTQTQQRTVFEFPY